MVNNELTILADIIFGKIQSCIDLRSNYYKPDKSLITHLEKILTEAQNENNIIKERIAAMLTSERDQTKKSQLMHALEASQDVEKYLQPMIIDCARNLSQNNSRDPLLASLHRLKITLAEITASTAQTIEKDKLTEFRSIWIATGAKTEVIEIIRLLALLKEAVIENETEYFIRKVRHTPPNKWIFDNHNYITQKELEARIMTHIEALQRKLRPLLPSDIKIVHSDNPINVPLFHKGPTLICNNLNFEKLQEFVAKDPRILPLALICSLYSTHLEEEGTINREYMSGPYSISITMKKLYLLLPVLLQAIPSSDFEEIKTACKALWDRRSTQFSHLVDHLLYYSKENMWKD